MDEIKRKYPVKRTEIIIRDPFVLPLEGEVEKKESGENGIRSQTYLMTGTIHIPGKKQGIYGYLSEDLENFSEPFLLFDPPEDFWADRDFWAPEIHRYQGKYYMFVSFRSAYRRRATQILSSERPEGPYLPISKEPHTPKQWHCLDGTLFIDPEGEPWMIYVREVVQMVDGEMYAQRLSRDLTHLEGEPVRLFAATYAPWCVTAGEGGMTFADDGYITDGPFVFRLPDGGLGMLWSSFCDSGYCQAVCYSESGKITGPWKQMNRPLYERDSGHGMLFSRPDGSLILVLHDNNRGESHPVFLTVEWADNRITIREEMKK